VLRALANAFKIPDLKRRIIFTLLLLVVYRLGAYIPTPGINGKVLARIFEDIATKTAGGTIFSIMDMFSGGALTQCAIFALGIMPYISSSIIFQLLTAVVPTLEKLAKEGEAGRRKISQYTRVGTVILCLIQSQMIALALENPGRISQFFSGYQIVEHPGWPFRLMTMLTLTAGSTFIMWLGEQITERGIGNGMSLIITTSIISRIPTALHRLYIYVNPFQTGKATTIGFGALIIMIALFIGVTVGVIAITQGQRKIPVQYAKRIVGRKVYGGQSTYIPLRVNQAGVIPIIFAQSLLLFPAAILSYIPNKTLQDVVHQIAWRGQLLHSIFYVALIVFFCYFYTAIAFNPLDVAENMKKYGGFIPGIRPGKPTSEYFDHVMVRITLAGAIFLAVIALFPDVVASWLRVDYVIASFFGGTGLLIIVGVMLDTMKQMESHLLMRHYEGFMKRGHLRSRR
jgi:preprotein translocase subunit SecY